MRVSLRHASMVAIHSSCVMRSTIGVRARRAARRSDMSATSTFTFLPTSEGSISTWIFFACGA